MLTHISIIIQIHAKRPLSTGQISAKILFIPQLSLSGRYNDEQNKYRPRLQEASGFIGKKSRVALLRFTKPSNASWQAGRARANVCEHLLGTEEERLSMVTWLSLYFHFNLLCRGRFTSWQTKKYAYLRKNIWWIRFLNLNKKHTSLLLPEWNKDHI